MDFLKYLDVIIGFSIVMVLLSPLVTAVTHGFLWWTNSRSTFLEQALQRLIVQLEGHPATVLSVQTADRTPAAGATVTTSPKKRTGGTAAWDPIAVLDQQGEAWFPDGLPAGSIVKGRLTFAVTGAPPGATLSVCRIPQAARETVTRASPPTDAAGKTSLTYSIDGPGITASTTARLLVTDAGGRPVEAQVKWSIGDNPGNAAVLPTGSDVEFLRPVATRSASSYKIDFDVARVDGLAPADLVVTAAFKRNDRFDRVLGPVPLDAKGRVSIQSSAMSIADAVVRHPMVARIPVSGPWPKIPPVKNRNAEVVEREELIRIVLELGASEGAGVTQISDSARVALQRLLALNEVPNAADALAAIRAESQRLEAAEPQLALHVRHAKAIVTAAPSAFVGKINHWFDAAMARATQQYAARARGMTIIAALLVAALLQFNSIDLLQRLSIDTTFRTSLVEMARTQQAQIDKLQDGSTPATPGTNDEIALLKANRQEIEQSLATLRAPDLAILPDHLPWQAVRRARVARDPLWLGPYPSRLQLLAGGKSWDVQPAWREDYVAELQAAIESSGAPLTVTKQHGRTYLVLRAETPFVASLSAGNTEIPLEGIGKVVETELRMTAQWPASDTTIGSMRLFIDSRPLDVKVDPAITRSGLIDHLSTRLATLAPALIVHVRCEQDRAGVPCETATEGTAAAAANLEKVLVVSARDRAIRDIRLLSDPDNPFSNRLTRPQRRPLGWRAAALDPRLFAEAPLRLVTHERDVPADRAIEVKVCVTEAGTNPCIDPATVAARAATMLQEELRTPSRDEGSQPPWWPATLTADVYDDDQLILTASRLGTLELRYGPGKPETNILGQSEQVRPWTETVWGSGPEPAGGERPLIDRLSNAFGPGVFGVLLSWALLSLGAPFWFDALKNALKLRPSAATTEERNSRDRQMQNPEPAKPTAPNAPAAPAAT